MIWHPCPLLQATPTSLYPDPALQAPLALARRLLAPLACARAPLALGLASCALLSDLLRYKYHLATHQAAFKRQIARRVLAVFQTTTARTRARSIQLVLSLAPPV